MDYDTRISECTKSYKKLMAYAKKTLKTTLTVTWKVHCVIAHLSKFLSMHGTEAEAQEE